jgi:hypothetical protein
VDEVDALGEGVALLLLDLLNDVLGNEVSTSTSKHTTSRNRIKFRPPHSP